MAGNNHIDAVHSLGQFLVLRGCQRVPGAAVGQADDDLRPLPLQLFYTVLGRFGGVRPGKAGGGRTFIGVHPHQPEQAVGDPAPLQRHAVGDAVIIHGRLDKVPVRVVLRRGIVGFQQGRERRGDGAVLHLIGIQLFRRIVGVRQQAHRRHLSRLGGIQHFPEADALVVEFMIADGHGVIPQSPHGPQFRRLRGIQGLDQGADGKVAAIHQQSGGIHRPFPVNGGFQPGVAATLPSLRRRLGEEVRVEIVGEQDGRDVRLLGAAFGHGAGREHTQHRQQQRQKKCGKTAEFHRVPPSYSKKRVR